jgi:hypothetical protein
MVYRWYIELVNGIINQLITWGAPPCGIRIEQPKIHSAKIHGDIFWDFRDNLDELYLDYPMESNFLRTV